LAIFNENEVKESGMDGWEADMAPFHLHDLMWSNLMIDALGTYIRELDDAVSSIGDEMERLDLALPSAEDVKSLQSHALDTSRRVSFSGTELEGLLGRDHLLWHELRSLSPFGLGVKEDEALSRKTRCGALKESLQFLENHEHAMRDMVVVTTSAVLNQHTFDLESKVFVLTKRLRNLTVWLIVLTILLLILGALTLAIAVFHDQHVVITRGISFNSLEHQFSLQRNLRTNFH
jgi:hypothetical protein